MAPPRKILVTGDCGVDYNLYLFSPDNGQPAANDQTRLVTSLGGAGIIYRLLVEASRLNSGLDLFQVSFAHGSTQRRMESPPTSAIWQPQPIGHFETDDCVWRLTRSLNLGKVSGLPSASKLRLPKDADSGLMPDILVIEDDAAGFRLRTPSRRWHPSSENLSDFPRWIVLKMTSPVCKGDLWWNLSRVGGPADRLVVVLSVNDLRLEDLRVSKGISWERTAIDLVREMKNNPELAGLRQSRHVIVTLHEEGALWIENLGSDKWVFHLIFDPQHMEEEWAENKGIQGGAYGFLSCFTASIAARLALSTDLYQTVDMACGIECGLRSMRLLRVLGHGDTKTKAPGFQPKELAKTIIQDNACEVTLGVSSKNGERLAFDCCKDWHFARVDIPEDVLEREQGPSRWHILEGPCAYLSNHQCEPLFGIAKRVALYGPKALVEAPIVSFGRLSTADRKEIEALNNIKLLIKEYRHQNHDHKPLSIAAFGPPGAGKSFGIKQIALEIMGLKTPFLEFNLSQFKDNTDLIGAFHQVRDKALEGYTPVVFWDEFDSENYRWLQYLLAPMQDGKFQEGQITHPIGKSIFVFAGATSYDIENFGPQRQRGKNEDAGKAWDEFKLRKGPDFKSRLHGYVNVLGPNRRQKFDPGTTAGNPWKDDPTDTCAPVRRSLLLRTLLDLAKGRLLIDRGLLAAMLEIDRYTYGARSFKKIVSYLRLNNKHGVIHRSSLPPDEIMSMHVDFIAFQRILTRSEDFQKFAGKIAPAVHDTYRQLADKEEWNFKYKLPFPELPPDIKADNVAAAHRIPWILELAGLFLLPKEQTSDNSDKQVKEIIESLIYVLAEEEHDLWMEHKLRQGWRLGKRNDEARIHDCLIPYCDLKEEDRRKDQNSVRNIPMIVDLAGFKIIRHKS
jgi:hypothetical protein